MSSHDPAFALCLLAEDGSRLTRFPAVSLSLSLSMSCRHPPFFLSILCGLSSALYHCLSLSRAALFYLCAIPFSSSLPILSALLSHIMDGLPSMWPIFHRTLVYSTP